MKPRTRRLTVELHDVKVRTSWGVSAVHIAQYGNYGKDREAVIAIRDPHGLRYLREMLDKIEAAWRAQLGT